MPAWAVRAFGALALALLISAPAQAERTAVQEVACQPGPELLLASDGTVSACRIAAAADLLVAPDAGNGKAGCAAGAQVEFHRNGYLSFCNPSGPAAAYVGARRPGHPLPRRLADRLRREGRAGILLVSRHPSAAPVAVTLSHIATGRTVLSCPM